MSAPVLIPLPEVADWDDHARRRADWDAAGWTERSQTLRFQAALRHLQPRPGETLVDYGCGPGRLAEFLDHRVRYIGIDRNDAMIARARTNHNAPGRLFTTINGSLRRCDLIACIGVWNLRRDGDSYTELERLWRTCPTVRSLVACLYRGVDPRCRAHDPGELADFANYLRVTRFAIDATYLNHDVLLALHRDTR